MKEDRRNSNSRSGVALIAVLIFIFTACALLASMAAVGTQRAFTARLLADRVKALAYAEAGAAEAYSILAADFVTRTNSALFSFTTYGEGSYDVVVTPVGDDLAIVCCTGVCRQAEASVIVDVKNYGGGGSAGRTWDTNVFNYAILCGGSLDFGGCGDISSTNGPVLLHSNSDMAIRGDATANVSIESSGEIDISNNVTIDGDVAAATLDYKPSKVTITGTAEERSVPLQTIPDIDLTPYFNYASNNGEVRNGFSMSGGTYSPVGGILWVNGDVHLSSHTVINGSIIATGDIDFGGQSDLTPTTCGFSLVSRDGDIKFTSGGTCEGLIYAKTGGLEHNANGSIEGQIIVNGDVRKTGNSGIIVYERIIPTPPGEEDPWAAAQVVGVSAWQK